MKKRLKKIFLIIGAVFAVLFTVYVLICSWVNWTGAKAWEEAKARLEEENIDLDFRKQIRELPPEDQNFARIPLIAALTDFEQMGAEDLEQMMGGNWDIVYEHPELRERLVGLRLPEHDDLRKTFLPSWSVAREADPEAGPDITGLMQEYATELAAIDAAAELPRSQIPLEIGDTFAEMVHTVLPFLQEFREIQKVETLRALRAIQRGDREEAMAALKVTFQLGHASNSHLTLIGFLVGQTHFSSAYDIIWQGMKSGLWQEADLKWIQARFAELDVLSELERSLTFEMTTFQIGAADFIKSISLSDSRHLVTLMGSLEEGNSSSLLGMLALLTPSGVWDHNKAFGVTVMLEESILPIRRRELPRVDGVLNALKERSAYNFLAGITLPATDGIARRGFYSEVAADLAEAACAVERYRMKEGEYPENLEALVPLYLDKVPEDLMAKGNPLQYEKLSGNARYRLYSVGQNGTDDGGKVAVKPGKIARDDREQGDWVWNFMLDSIEAK